MTNEQYNEIIKLIDNDVKNKNYEHLTMLKNYLNEAMYEYDNPEIKDNIDLLTMNLKSFLEEINLGDAKSNVLFDEVRLKYASDCNLFNIEDVDVYVFQMLMFEKEEVAKMRFWGDVSVEKFTKILNDLGLNFGMKISSNDQKKLLEYAFDKKNNKIR